MQVEFLVFTCLFLEEIIFNDFKDLCSAFSNFYSFGVSRNVGNILEIFVKSYHLSTKKNTLILNPIFFFLGYCSFP